MRTLFRARFFIVAAIILATSALAGGFLLGRNQRTSDDFIEVKRGEIIEEVIVTGQVRAADQVSLGFLRSGRVLGVHVKVGNRVGAGARLAELESADLVAERAEAEAKAAVERAKLDELLRGTRPEELAIAEAKVSDSLQGLIDGIRDAYSKADDAIRVKVDQFFSNARTANPQLNFIVSEPMLEQRVESDRRTVEVVLISWRDALEGLGTTAGDVHGAAATASANLSVVREFLDAAALMLSTVAPSGSLTQSTVDTYRSAVSTARANVNTASRAVSAGDTNLTIRERELALARAGSTPEEVAAARAALTAAEAAFRRIQAELAKTVIRAPVAGLVTTLDLKVGEIVSANTPVLTLMSETGFEIKANVPEVDIGSVKVGDPVAIRLDAFPSEAFHGAVAAVDPAETVVEGVVNFEITVAFSEPDPRLKSGLTANLAIETARKSGVLVLPQHALIERDSGTFVRRHRGGETKDVSILIGLRGRGALPGSESSSLLPGMVEISGGLAEGDLVLPVGLRQGEEQ